jgi:phosphinothricin acetyltransferase
MADAHADAVLAIYQAGIEEGNATFETRAPDWAPFTAARLPAHRYVATTGGQVAGWVAVSAVSGRCVYAGVAEHSVYIHPASLAVHRAAGFRVVGTRERIGQHHGRWRDAILIERRIPAL